MNTTNDGTQPTNGLCAIYPRWSTENLNVAEHWKFGKGGKAFDGAASSTIFHLHPVEFRVWTPGQHKNTCKVTGCYSGVMCNKTVPMKTFFELTMDSYSAKTFFYELCISILGNISYEYSS